MIVAKNCCFWSVFPQISCGGYPQNLSKFPKPHFLLTCTYFEATDGWAFGVTRHCRIEGLPPMPPTPESQHFSMRRIWWSWRNPWRIWANLGSRPMDPFKMYLLSSCMMLYVSILLEATDPTTVWPPFTKNTKKITKVWVESIHPSSCWCFWSFKPIKTPIAE